MSHINTPQKTDVNMANFRILSFERTPSIQNQIGIINVILSETWASCFKVVEKKDGGFFVAPATLKAEPGDDGVTRWRDGVQPDSKTLKDEFYAAMRDFVKLEISKDLSNDAPF